MTLIIRDRKITRRVFAQRGSLAVAGGVLVPLVVNSSDLSPATSAGSGQSTAERLAMYQEEGARGVVCRICPNECTLKEGEVSDCRNRVVRQSKLYTMAFGNPCAVNTDPV